VIATRRQLSPGAWSAIFAGLGQRQDDIAAIVGCSEKTLRLYYRNELDEGLADANAAIISVLHSLMQAGNISAQIFYDKCRGGRRSRPTKIEHPKLPSQIMIEPPCDNPSRCDNGLDQMYRRHFFREAIQNRQQTIAMIRAEIDRIKSVPKDFLEEQQRCLRWYNERNKSQISPMFGGSNAKERSTYETNTGGPRES